MIKKNRYKIKNLDKKRSKLFKLFLSKLTKIKKLQLLKNKNFKLRNYKYKKYKLLNLAILKKRKLIYVNFYTVFFDLLL